MTKLSPGVKRTRAVLVVVVLSLIVGAFMLKSLLKMPGKSFEGTLDPLDASGLELRQRLESDVRALATEIGMRNTAEPERLIQAARWVEAGLARSGKAVARQEFEVDGVVCENLEVELRGAERQNEIVVVGAHYDSAHSTSGADDNASGTAALLALAERFATTAPARTLRFVAFSNEEPPHFQHEAMGSLRYARRSRERGETIVAMLSLESIGYYSDAPGSQKYPFPLSFFYPSRGNFIAFVGNRSSQDLTRQLVGWFREDTRFPCEGAALPEVLPGVGWSDHWSFWQVGYPGVMVTDTAPFRNPNYHELSDKPETLDYDRFTRVVLGLEKLLTRLSR
jgi:hypothetical protein